jgi:type IV pilus assembly protein PilB
MRNLGHILVDRELITDEQLREAEEQQRDTGRSLGRVLVDRNMVTEKDLVAALATQIGMEFVDIPDADVDPRATTMLSDAIMRRHNVLPIGFDQGKLVLAMSDPSNVVAIDDVRTLTKMEVKAVVATKEDVTTAIEKYASMSDDIETMADDLAGDQDDDDLSDLHAVTEDAPIVKFVNLLISQAVADGASDIHIEPGER